MPCLVEEVAMAGLLLLGLLACAPVASPDNPTTLLLTELCYHTLDIEEIQYQLGNNSIRVMPVEGKL